MTCINYKQIGSKKINDISYKLLHLEFISNEAYDSNDNPVTSASNLPETGPYLVAPGSWVFMPQGGRLWVADEGGAFIEQNV